jgi:hypothetical protein
MAFHHNLGSYILTILKTIILSLKCLKKKIYNGRFEWGIIAFGSILEESKNRY